MARHEGDGCMGGGAVAGLREDFWRVMGRHEELQSTMDESRRHVSASQGGSVVGHVVGKNQVVLANHLAIK